jgi:hypothetical protein
MNDIWDYSTPLGCSNAGCYRAEKKTFFLHVESLVSMDERSVRIGGNCFLTMRLSLQWKQTNFVC